MNSGIYAYWDNKLSYYVYIGKDSYIDKNERHKSHLSPSKYDEQQFNHIIQNNPERYEYRILMKGNYNEKQLNKMEQFCIKHLKTYHYDYPERHVFNFTKGGDGFGAGEDHPSYRDDLDDDVIRDEYVNQGLSSREIAKRHNTIYQTIISRLKKCGVDTSKNIHNKRHDLVDDVIRDEYVNQGLSCTEIAKRHNTNTKTICNRLNNLGVDTSRNTTGFYNVSKKKTPKCKQGFRWVYQYYDENGKRKSISSVDIEKLEVKVKEKGLKWRKL